MTALAYAKDTVRATILVMFVFSYGAAMALQAALVGVSRETMVLAASFVPATLIGILLGRLSAGRISEHGFRWLISLVLVATSLGLLFTSIGSFLGNV